jgi:hypothetical protein
VRPFGRSRRVPADAAGPGEAACAKLTSHTEAVWTHVTTSPRTRSTVIALVAASFVMLAMVLGLWQSVDQACHEGDAPARDALLACDAVPMAEIDAPNPGIEATEATTEASPVG